MPDRWMGMGGGSAALLLCLALFSCGKQGSDRSEGPKQQGAQAGPSSASGESSAHQKAGEKRSSPAKAGGDEGAASAPTSLFEEPASALSDVKKKLGRDQLTVLQLAIFPTYLHIQVQDPNEKGHVDEYRWRAGTVEGPTPVKLTGKTDVATINKRVFNLAEADVGAVAKMVEDAVQRLDLEDGKVTHVVLERQAPFRNAVQFRVYITGLRNSGSVSYDAQGAMVRVWK